MAENQTPLTSADFLIDGKSLFKMLYPHFKMDLAGVFSSHWFNQAETAKIFKLQKLSDINGHRALIYCCSECGDITCGGITVKIQKNEDSIEWSDFAYENNYDEKMTNRESFMGVGPFKFAVDEYMHAVDLAANFREE